MCRRKPDDMEEIIKLERLKFPNACSSSAENIFREITQATGALVLWESGCKSLPVRKEPLIKISGPEESVQKAKEMLLDRMEIQNNRVVMKIDVTHFEHPSLIGKGGKLIKKVMEATNCHIHFPDGNKCLGLEKSNQVSIYGDPLNVERSRVMLRALIPLQVYFEVPPTSPFASLLETSTETKLLAGPQGLLIYSAPTQNGTLIIVRCNQDQFPNRRKDLTMLMEVICSTNGANLPAVHMLIDIMQQHQQFVKGKNCSNIEGIMKRTGAKITFPNLNTARSERSSVKISGNLDCVYMAWQEIMNCLPVSVSFDVNCTRETRGDYMEFLQDCGIHVYNRLKPKYYIKNVTVKGTEKFSKQMLQFRQHLLRLPSLYFGADMQAINLASSFLSSLADDHSSSPNIIPPAVTSVVAKYIAAEAFQQITNTYNNSAFLETVQHQLQFCNSPILSPNAGFSTPPGAEQLSNQSSPVSEKLEDYFAHIGKSISCASSGQNISSFTFGQNSLNNNDTGFADLSKSPDCLKTSNSWEYNKLETDTRVSTPQSPDQGHNDKDQDSFAEDYYRQKVLASKAMRRPIESMESAQVPSSQWAGCGFSQSMPAVVNNKSHLPFVKQYSYFGSNNGSSCSSSEDSESWENVVLKDCRDGDIWSNKKDTTFSHSNYFDFLRNMPVPFDYATKDILPELLWQHGLHKYIDIFAKEEIDYQTFLLLSDTDLSSLDISHHARMKLICLIRELQDISGKITSPFNAAPGAGRKN